jgi:hypothetical protein
MYDMTIGWWHITIIAEVTEPVKVKKKYSSLGIYTPSPIC